VCMLAFGWPGEQGTKDDPHGYYEVVDMAAAVPLLKELLDDKDPGVRGAAASALLHISPQFGPTVVPVLTALLTDKDPNVRWMAVWDLGKVGPEAKAALPTLTGMIHDPGHGVKSNIAEALEKISPEAAKAAAPALMDLLKDNDSSVQTRTARVLMRLDPKLKAAVIPILLGMLKDGSDARQSNAADLLGEIGPDALDPAAVKQAVSDMKRLLNQIHEHGNWCCRLDTAVALAKLDPAEKPFAVSMMIELLRYSYWGTRWTTAEALAKMGPDAKAAVPALTELLNDEQARVRQVARKALEKIQGGSN
jgi:HEAT repeat protein